MQRVRSCGLWTAVGREEEAGDTLDSLIRILKKPSSQRAPSHLSCLLSFTRDIKFFRHLSSDLSEDAVSQCCLHMTYAYHRRNEFVFQQGDLGSKFYVVLEGEVDVIVTMDDGSGNEVANEVGKCSAGDAFGELALLTNKPRAASIYCTLDSHFAVLDKSDYTRILSKIHEQKIAQKVDFLQDLPVFATWTRGSLQKLTYYFREKVFRRKQILYHSGDKACELLLIKEGEVEVMQDLPTRLRTDKKLPTERKYVQRTEVVILGKGETVGYEEIISQNKHQFTYICRSTTASVLAIAREDFLKRVNREDSVKSLQKIAEIKAAMRGQRRIELKDRQKAGFLRSKGPDLPKVSVKTPILESNTERNASVPRLYPDLSSRDSPSSPKSPRKHPSLSKVFSLKPEKPTFRLLSQPTFVNIHTQKQRKRTNGRFSRTYSFAPEPLAATERTLGPFLTINFVEIVKMEESDSPQLQRRTERGVRSSSSQFRGQRLSA